VIRTHATPARQQLQALAGAGFPDAWIADQIGMSTTGVNRLRTAQTARTGEYTIRTIDRLHQRLAGTTAVDHGIPERTAAIVRLYAARSGWTSGNAA
jgi:hypothetical protein